MLRLLARRVATCVPPTPMATSSKTARELFAEVMANPARKKFGYGHKVAIVNVDFQRAYTDGTFKTSYMTDPKQLDYVNELSALARSRGLPVVWTHVAYVDDASDAGVWGTRTDIKTRLVQILETAYSHANSVYHTSDSKKNQDEDDGDKHQEYICRHQHKIQVDETSSNTSHTHSLTPPKYILLYNKKCIFTNPCSPKCAYTFISHLTSKS